MALDKHALSELLHALRSGGEGSRTSRPSPSGRPGRVHLVPRVIG